MTTAFRSLPVSLALLIAMSACGGGQAAKVPRLELDPSELEAEIESIYPLSLRNTGDKALTLTAAPTLTANGCPDDPEGAAPFTMVVQDAVTFPVQIAPQSAGTVEGMLSQVLLTITYDSIPTTCERVATITIFSDDPDHPTLEVHLRLFKAEPNIEADPPVVNLGAVEEGTGKEDVMNILNTGLGDLHLTSVSFIGQVGFAILWPCELLDGSRNEEWKAIGAQAQVIGSDVCKPILIPRNESLQVRVKYQAASADKAEATVIVVSDDPDYNASAGEGLEVKLHANWGGPCVRVVPSPVDFGPVIVPGGFKAIAAVLESCGDEDVQVTGIRFLDDTHKDFQLDIQPLGAFNAANPLTLAAGATSSEFYVKCVPESLNTDDTGALLADTGTLLVQNNSAAPQLKVPLKCLPSKKECAVCGFELRLGKNGKVLKDGDSINPQQTLYFKDTSYDKSAVDNGIKDRTWSNPLNPPGNASIFQPNNVHEEVSFQPNIVGEYQYCLEVENNQGCVDNCCTTIVVAPPTGCHVELTWKTPADADETDECGPEGKCGSDVDLHVVHPYATSEQTDVNGEAYGYFDSTYDCFWANPHPTWNIPNASDPRYQPNLDRDDTNGAGPENFTYTIPEDGKCYRIGVHYYNDNAFGRSYPTVRVYINDITPVYEKTAAKGIVLFDMWDVGRVCCTNPDAPFEEFKKTNGDPVIEHNYESPF